MTTLQQELERWEADLDHIADISTTENWYLEERRLAEAQHTIAAYRGRILPEITNQPYDAIVADEIEQLVDRLEDLRTDLFRNVHPTACHQQIAETVAALRSMAHIALRFQRILEDVQ